MLSGTSIKACKAASSMNPNVISYIYSESHLLCAIYCIENME